MISSGWMAWPRAQAPANASSPRAAFAAATACSWTPSSWASSNPMPSSSRSDDAAPRRRAPRSSSCSEMKTAARPVALPAIWRVAPSRPAMTSLRETSPGRARFRPRRTHSSRSSEAPQLSPPPQARGIDPRLRSSSRARCGKSPEVKADSPMLTVMAAWWPTLADLDSHLPDSEPLVASVFQVPLFVCDPGGHVHRLDDLDLVPRVLRQDGDARRSGPPSERSPSRPSPARRPSATASSEPEGARRPARARAASKRVTRGRRSAHPSRRRAPRQSAARPHPRRSRVPTRGRF